MLFYFIIFLSKLSNPLMFNTNYFNKFDAFLFLFLHQAENKKKQLTNYHNNCCESSVNNAFRNYSRLDYGCSFIFVSWPLPKKTIFGQFTARFFLTIFENGENK